MIRRKEGRSSEKGKEQEMKRKDRKYKIYLKNKKIAYVNRKFGAAEMESKDYKRKGFRDHLV